MKKYKRLTFRADGGIGLDCKACKHSRKTCMRRGEREKCGLAARERLAELEDKIERGILVELPCNVGDILYKICPQGRAIKMGDMRDGKKVERPCQRCPWESCSCVNIGYMPDMENIVQAIQVKTVQFIFDISPFIGKVWFLTETEARKALKEFENGR